MSAPRFPSLDRRSFRMVSSTTSQVNPDQPTIFSYRENQGLLWGDYVGAAVHLGRFVGSRSGDRLSITWAHVSVQGGLMTGRVDSTIVRVDEKLQLVEQYELNGGKQTNVVEEIPEKSIAEEDRSTQG